MLSLLLVEQDGFNDFVLDHDFFSEFAAMPLDKEHKHFKSFIDECCTRLTQRTMMSMTVGVVNLQKPGFNYQITTDLFWKVIKYEFIAEKIIEQLEIPAQEKMFKDEFKKHGDDKISYYDFYQLLTHKDKFNIHLPVEYEWVFNDFFFEIDYDDNATFDYEDISDFLRKTYNYVIDDTIPDKPDQVKKNQDPITYQLTEKDYFRAGCTTILNSEVAAVKMCLNMED
jgi:hypothetical protein